MISHLMQNRTKMLLVAVVLGGVSTGSAQQSKVPPPPATKAAIAEWDVALARQAAELLKSPAQWNRADNDHCPADARTYSIRCALVTVLEEAVGVRPVVPPSTKSGTTPAPLLECEFRSTGNHREGSCGPLFEEMPVFTLSRVPAVTSGTWQSGQSPTSVWAGVMWDAENVVMTEARQTVGQMTTKKYSARLIDYNNDSLTTFADLQKFFSVLHDRLIARKPSDLADEAGDSVEIEIYRNGTGVIRTYAGWYPVSSFAIRDSVVRFKIDTANEVPPSALDRKILERAATIITSDAVWNRADNRKCAPTATTWSIYCAVERAELEVTGGFHHRRPAMELVRTIVDERTKDRQYQHRLMEYNNDQSTRLDDVRTLFAEAIKRIKA